MRIAMLIVLLAAGGFRFVEVPVDQVDGGPPIEIRMDGRATDDFERRIGEIREKFPDLQRHRTTRFEILSDLPPAEVAQHGALLERTAHAVESFREALGIDWGIGDQDRQLVVAFASQDDFVRFAAGFDQLNARWLAGYFSPRHGHLAYHDAHDHPGVRRIEGRHRREIVARGEAAAPEAVDADPRLAGLRRFVSRTNASVVIHEATHMLLHRRDILAATIDTPLWLAEGLAGSFEPVEPDRRFGPMRPSNGRTVEFRELLSEDRVPSLRSLLLTEQMPDARSVNAFYASSAALCSWLVRQRPDSMRRYLEDMPRRRSATPVARAELGNAVPEAPSIEDPSMDESADARVVAFELAFGDLTQLEREWIAWERAMLDTSVSAVDDRD
ncbi:MAG: hypothetical protein RLZZ461_387 [Planctomycetota bacterium]|jgi:hypothetical protein